VSTRERAVVLVTWLALGPFVGVTCGAASALFLWLLDQATAQRTAQPWLVYALPVAGLVIGWTYQRFGAQVKAGNNLVIDTIHDDRPELPLRMAPLVLVGTVMTHLFGGSAGREGTAVQMGASLSDFVSHRLKLDQSLRRQLLIAGVAGGFGSVFGTPFAGAIFGLELVVFGGIQWGALVPSLVASVVGDMATRALGIEHTVYPVASQLRLSPLVLGKWALFALAIAAVTIVFIELVRFIKQHAEKHVSSLPLRLALGGVAVVLLWLAVGSSDYLGLGVPTIVRAFSDPALPMDAFAWKLLFTAITLGAGFIGGEVTPLFFIGATLGNVLARGLGLPLDLGAGVGMAAVFAAASSTPIALSVMAVELLGVGALPHVVLVSVLAYLLSGRRSIYSAQRLGHKPSWFHH
jgi:H+/Cl- antiporter ClcA